MMKAIIFVTAAIVAVLLTTAINAILGPPPLVQSLIGLLIGVSCGLTAGQIAWRMR